jgi:hypothetical protein
MSNQNKFEQMLELLVNEDKAAAQELFHEIVVEKSRDIYESLLEDEAEVDEADDEAVDESDEDLDEADDEAVDESDEDLDENFDLDTFEVEADDDMGPTDQTGDLAADLGMNMDDEGEEGDEDEGEEGDVEDRVEDLEDALDDLKAEFEKMMAGDDEGDDMDDMGDDEGEEEPEEAFAFEATDEEVDESDDTEIEEGGHSDQMIKDKENMSKAEFEKKYGDAAKDMDESAKSASETMREYVEKVSATMGDNGANNASAVAKPNNMGGTAGNLNQAGSDASSETGAGKKIAGSALNDQNAKDIGTGNVNVPGGKAAKAGKTVPAGHGAEKKGAGETADKAAGSTLNKVSSRAK